MSGRPDEFGALIRSRDVRSSRRLCLVTVFRCSVFTVHGLPDHRVREHMAAGRAGSMATRAVITTPLRVMDEWTEPEGCGVTGYGGPFHRDGERTHIGG